MFSYAIEEWLLFFYIYCVFGWCFESTYVSIRTGHPVNRGFMQAPFLPLYGSGAILLLIIGNIFANSLLFTYIFSCLGATLLEFFTGYTMERMFKIKYWDYSKQPFNLQGHVCLMSSLFWGVLGIFLTRVLHAPIENFVLALPEQVKVFLAVFITAVLAGDFALSFRDALDLREILIDMEKMEVILKDVVAQQVSDQKLLKVKAFSDKLEIIRNGIQAQLSARYEVKVSRKV
jgi:uncharacterized membrane protein